MSERTMLRKVKVLKELEEQKKNLENEIEKLKEEMKRELLQRDAEELQVGNHIMRYTSMMSQRFNNKDFKEKHPRLYKQFLQTKETRRFSIA